VKYLSLCSGIEAASVAWAPLGWECAAVSEIDPFPCAVLNHHYPDVPNLGDMEKITDEQIEGLGAVDVLVGGTPCQSFSVAGLRGGMADSRGNLALRFLEIARRLRPDWVVWENVPGVLSSNGGKDFGTFLGGLGECGYGFAYRVLDAQYFGVAQRRRRVFVVGHFGDWRRSAAVLLERESLCGHSAPRREAGARVAACLTRGAESSGKGGYAGRRQEDDVNIVAHTLRGDGFDASEDGTGRGTPLVPTWPADVAPTLNAAFGDKQGLEDQHAMNGAGLFVPSVCFQQNQRNEVRLIGGDGATAGALPSSPGMKQQNYLAQGVDLQNTTLDGDLCGTLRGEAQKRGNTGAGVLTSAVRRLTPTECERLQGFPDGYTRIPYRKKSAENCPDGPRYKALGNSMAVPVMRWLGERIKQVSATT